MAIVGKNELLAKVEGAVDGAICLAFTAPYADQGQQGQQTVMEVGAKAKVGGVIRDRQFTQARDVSAGGFFGDLRSQVDGGVGGAAQGGTGGGGVLGRISHGPQYSARGLTHSHGRQQLWAELDLPEFAGNKNRSAAAHHLACLFE